MAMWVSVNNRDNAAPIRNAYFSVTNWNNGDGNYYVYVNSGTRFWCDANGFQVQYATAQEQNMQISLPPAVWPEQ